MPTPTKDKAEQWQQIARQFLSCTQKNLPELYHALYLEIIKTYERRQLEEKLKRTLV